MTITIIIDHATFAIILSSASWPFIDHLVWTGLWPKTFHAQFHWFPNTPMTYIFSGMEKRSEVNPPWCPLKKAALSCPGSAKMSSSPQSVGQGSPHAAHQLANQTHYSDLCNLAFSERISPELLTMFMTCLNEQNVSLCLSRDVGSLFFSLKQLAFSSPWSFLFSCKDGPFPAPTSKPPEFTPTLVLTWCLLIVLTGWCLVCSWPRAWNRTRPPKSSGRKYKINGRSCEPKGTQEVMGIKSINEASHLVIVVCVRIIKDQDCACVRAHRGMCVYFRRYHYFLGAPDSKFTI